MGKDIVITNPETLECCIDLDIATNSP